MFKLLKYHNRRVLEMGVIYQKYWRERKEKLVVKVELLPIVIMEEAGGCC